MYKYEMMILSNPELDDKNLEKSMQKYLDIIKKDNGKIDNFDVWGRRKLAYDIQNKSEANYVVINFSANSSTAAEVNRQLGNDESIMRVKIIRLDKK